jgi:hypothetical protein
MYRFTLLSTVTAHFDARVTVVYSVKDFFKEYKMSVSLNSEVYYFAPTPPTFSRHSFLTYGENGGMCVDQRYVKNCLIDVDCFGCTFIPKPE